jgi:hypothetical protein
MYLQSAVWKLASPNEGSVLIVAMLLEEHQRPCGCGCWVPFCCAHRQVDDEDALELC